MEGCWKKEILRKSWDLSTLIIVAFSGFMKGAYRSTNNMSTPYAFTLLGIYENT